MDERVLEHRDSHTSTSHEPSVEPKPSRKVGIWVKHSVYAHFWKDRICEIYTEVLNKKGSVQKTYRQSRTSCRILCDYRRSKSSQ